ncbi:MAG: SMI1/KNR4 family protein [Methylophilaceae bacterium]
MTTINLTEHYFQINGVSFTFPIEINTLKNVLGNCRHVKLQHNNIYTWDDLGISAYSKNGLLVENISIDIQSGNYQFSPKNLFTGSLLFNGVDAIGYYKTNKNKRVKLFKGDASGAIVLNGISFWFNMDKSHIQAIEIGAYLAPAQLPKPLAVDAPFRHYFALWQTWIAETCNIVSGENRYYNLTHGITEQDIANHNNAGFFEMPSELLNFYKIHNVDYDGVTSVYSFMVNGWQYDLIPFEKIRDDWASIQTLNGGFDTLDFTGFSDKVKSTDYANSHWIPFAEGRNGDYLLFDADPSQSGVFGQIIELQNESWLRSVVAESLAQLLQNEINLIKSGNKDFEFILEES